MNVEKLKKNYQGIDKNILEKVSEVIRKGEIGEEKNKSLIKKYLEEVNYDYCNNICEFICSLFHVDRSEVLSSDGRSDITHARWMYWNALSFMLKLTYREISVLSSVDGAKVSLSAISLGIGCLQEDMRTNMLLRNKWYAVKQMIFVNDNPDRYEEPFSEPIGHPISHVHIVADKNVKFDIENN